MSFNPRSNGVPASIAAAKSQVAVTQARIAASAVAQAFGLNTSTPAAAIGALLDGYQASRDAAMRRFGITPPGANKR